MFSLKKPCLIVLLKHVRNFPVNKSQFAVQIPLHDTQGGGFKGWDEPLRLIYFKIRV
jgi:hypothetical protein